MNLFLFILSVAGLCYGLESNNHYKYNYSAYFKSGIPDDGNQVVGTAMKAIVEVFIENTDGIAIFKLSDFSTFNFNEDFGEINEEIDFTNKRFRHLEDEDLGQIFEQPFRVNLRDSNPFAIEYEESEHRWLSNVRKGIASMFKNEILKGNFVNQVKDSFSSLFHQGHLVNNFYVDEETLFGICKTKYNIHQIPDTMFTGSNDLTPNRQNDTKNDLWQLTRTIDFENCKEIVALHVHTTNNRKHKHKKLRFTRSSVSSYVLRGSPGHFDLYSVLTEGTTTYPLSLFNKNEEAQSTVKQKLVLIDEGHSEVLPKLGTNLKHSTTWMHEVWSPFQKPKESKHYPWIVYSNKNEPDVGFEMFGTKDFDDEQIALVKSKIIEIIRVSSQRLTDLHQEAGDPPSEAISESLEMATYYFRFLKKKDYLKIFDHIFERGVGIEKQLVINAAAATGFYQAIEAIMDYVEEGKLENFQVFTTLMTLSRNSFGSLNISRIMDYLLRGNKPSEYLLNFAHYLSEYCIHKVHTYVPIVGDAECDSFITTTRFIPYLKKIIYNENLTWERAYAVKVLHLLRSGFTFEILSPLIDGRMKSSVVLKTMAVRALENWSIYPEMNMKTPIIDLLTDVYSDVSQDFYVRTAALLSIISWEPNTKFWYNLALNTWKEPSREFASFASSLIKTYAGDNLPSSKKQSKGAVYALKFAKPPSKSSLSYSNFEFSKEFFNRQTKLSLFFSELSKGDSNSYFEAIFDILTNIEQLSLHKIEIYNLYDEKVTNFNKTVEEDRSNIPDANEFLQKFYGEIHYLKHPYERNLESITILNIVNDIFIKADSLQRLSYVTLDRSNPRRLYSGIYLYLMDKLDFHPNELGLPLYTQSSLPIAIGSTTEFLPSKSGKINRHHFLLRFSSVYNRGISVFLPWSLQFSTAMVRSNLELSIPIGSKEKRIVGTEGPLRSSKTSYEFIYKKKFPLVHLSSTPLTITYDSVEQLEKPVISFEVIKKSNIKEKRINEVDPITGIKYDLVMRADTPTSIGLLDFLQFPDTPFRVWSLDFYLDPESGTREVLVTDSRGKLLNKDKYEDPGIDHYSNEVFYNDNFKERSWKIRKNMKFANETVVNYREYKLDFIGNVTKRFEFFNAVHLAEISDKEYYRFETVGLTSSISEQQLHNPKSMCFELHNLYSDVSTNLQNYQAISPNIQVKLGCTENIIEATVNYKISEELSNKTKKYCLANYGEEKCFFEDSNLLNFDNIEIVLTLYNDRNVQLLIKGIMEFFSVKGFDFWNTEQNSRINIRKNAYHDHWDLYQNKESEHVLLSTISDNIIKFLVKYPDLIPDFVTKGQKCSLTTNSIKTFDGVNFNYELSNCWTLVSQTEEDYDQNEVFLIRKSKIKSSIPNFKYFKFSTGTVIDFSNNQLKVNGSIVHIIKDDESESSDTIVKDLIYKRRNTYLISTRLGKIYIIINKNKNNKIEYYKYKSQVKSNGICGNDDRETIPELIGPKKCVYNDAQMFTASWTGESENCDSAVLKEYRKGIEDYQTNCQHFDGQRIGSVMNHRCLFFGWKILTFNENSYCISASPLTFCSCHCDIKKVKTVEMAYKCWPKEKAPLRLRTSIENKDDIITVPISADPNFYETFSTEMAKICKQF